MGMGLEDVLAELRVEARVDRATGMASFGISGKQVLGVSVPILRRLARRAGRDDALATALWKTGLHEARILATMVTDPAATSAKQLDAWLRDLDSWDLTDGFVGNLVVASPWAWSKVKVWARRRAEFEKRAGFALMAYLAVHDKAAGNDAFRELLALVVEQSDDERLYVKKAVNWALRQIGKRNDALHKAAVTTAERLRESDSRAARWIAADALRELRNEKVLARLQRPGKGEL